MHQRSCWRWNLHSFSRAHWICWLIYKCFCRYQVATRSWSKRRPPGWWRLLLSSISLKMWMGWQSLTRPPFWERCNVCTENLRRQESENGWCSVVQSVVKETASGGDTPKSCAASSKRCCKKTPESLHCAAHFVGEKRGWCFLLSSTCMHWNSSTFMNLSWANVLVHNDW